MEVRMKIDHFAGACRFLSNFEPAKITIAEHGLTFPTVEHAYQAAKYNLDQPARLQAMKDIAALDTPGQAKRAGRMIPLRPDWDRVKLPIMRRLVRLKFFGNGHLAILLLATEPAELIEGNTWGDTYWGVCNGKGRNHLGKLLMSVRSELKAVMAT
jgi:ribA/ribD-fused uncharacterized protein